MPSQAVLKTMMICVSVYSTNSHFRREPLGDGQSEVRAMTSVAAAPITAKVTDSS